MNLFGDDEIETEDAGAALEAELTLDGELSGLLPPSQNPFSYGFSAQELSLLKLYNADKMPHALIFAGGEGIGKQTFAYRLARFLLAQQISDPNQDSMFGSAEPVEVSSLDLAADHPTFRRIASGGHSDFLAIERKFDEAKGKHKDSVDVAEVRRIAPFLRMTAAEGGWRAVIVNDADTMKRSAQNAILKILEEPPANTLLILIAHRPGALIPTIRSRARVIHFQALAIGDFEALLQQQGHYLAQAELQALYTLAEASIGRALDLIDQGGLDVMGKVITMFEDYPEWRWPQIHVVAEDLARSNNAHGFAMFRSVMQWIAKQLALSKARARALPAGPLASLGVFESMQRNSSLESLMKICDTLQGHFDMVERGNLEKRQAVLKAFSIFTG